jgi:hypothetical protein
MRTLPRLVWTVCLIIAFSAGDLLARPRTFVAGKGVRLKVDVPAGYSFKTESNQAGMTLVRMENPVWNIKVNVLISPEYDAKTESEEWQRNMVVTQSADFLAQSKEQDYKFLPLKPANGSGVYCVFTDAEAKRPEDLKPGEVMHVVVGAKVIRGAVMYFQIFNNDVKSAEYLEVFDLFISGFDEA